MAYTTSFLVKNQGVGQNFMHLIRVTADATSGAISTGFNVVNFVQHSPQSASTGSFRVLMNKSSGLTAANGDIALSGLVSGDVIYLTVYGR